jgi:hypothetical protein
VVASVLADHAELRIGAGEHPAKRARVDPAELTEGFGRDHLGRKL